jgi:MerR family transcriptional regulator, thiopeptide resistance regulator
MPSALKVGDLAKQTGVSVRTLHYYDEIGLLSPSHRTEAGYRLYSEKDSPVFPLIASFNSIPFACGSKLPSRRNCSSA